MELYYWPCRFRGNIIRLILAEANVQYQDIHDYQAVEKFVFLDKTKSIPTFAPPVLRVGEFVLSQSSAIAQYLAKKHGLEPEGGLEQSALALMIFNQCNDFLLELTRSHGYYDMWDAQKWAEFKPTTYKQYLEIFEELLRKHSNGDHFMFGEKITYVDFALYTILDGLVYDFKQQDFVEKFPKLFQFYIRMNSRESVKSVVEKQKALGWSFCGGEIQKNIESVAIGH